MLALEIILKGSMQVYTELVTGDFGTSSHPNYLYAYCSVAILNSQHISSYILVMCLCITVLLNSIWSAAGNQHLNHYLSAVLVFKTQENLRIRGQLLILPVYFAAFHSTKQLTILWSLYLPSVAPKLTVCVSLIYTRSPSYTYYLLL